MAAAEWAAWLRRSVELIDASTEALNAMNVFPISDSDTGDNIRLTLAGIAQAAVSPGATIDDIVQAAIVSAHGNSGAILAEMVTSVGRAIERDQGLPAGRSLANLLSTAAAAANRAVARPVAGTVLTVADAAAAGATVAAEEHPDDALHIAQAAARTAAAALQLTPSQLPVLAEAGVVDAGGQAFVLLLDALVEALGGEPAAPLPAVPGRIQSHAGRRQDLAEYEVMYVLRGAAPDGLARLREELSVVGHSVVVVGDEQVAQVHVHLAEAGPAIEAGLDKGALSQIRVVQLSHVAAEMTRAVVAVVAGDGLADAVRALGATPIRTGPSLAIADQLRSVLQQTSGDAVLLPNDMESLEAADHVATTLRGAGRRVAVIPTVAQVQGLAALAVHDPEADFDRAVVAMSTAGAHVRHGAVTIAESSAMTMAGRCAPGDVLGLVEGDFVVIGDSVLDVAWRVVERLLAAGGDLLTLATGAAADPRLGEDLRRRVHEREAGMEIEIVDGGQSRYLLLVGVE